MKTHLNCCSKVKIKEDDLNQTIVHDFYSVSKRVNIPKKIKLAVARASAEFSALDGRAFETITGDGFHNLAQVLFEAGRSFAKSSIQVPDLLPHPT